MSRVSVLAVWPYRLVVVAILLVLGGHLHWMHGGYALGMLGVALIAWMWSARRVRAAPVLMRIPLLILLIALLVYTIGSPIGRDGGSALLAGLLVMKLLETRSVRDARVTLASALFLSMVGFLFGQELSLTLYFTLAVVAIFAVLLQLTTDPSAASLQRVWQGLRLRAGNTLLMALAAIPVTVCIFVFLPRLSTPMWGAPWDAAGGRSGISDTMRPGQINNLWLDDTPVFRVEFKSGALPPPSALYWRGPVLWSFDGVEWGRATAYLGDDPKPFQYDPASVVEYEVLMEPTEQTWWFPLDLPLNVPEGARLIGDYQMRTRRPLIQPEKALLRSAFRYALDVTPERGHRWLAIQYPRQTNPQAQELASIWRARHGEDRQAIVDEALGWFNREFTYTLDPPPLGKEIVDDFLFNTKAGYCEYFASSFVFLMRAAGVPARVVTGYQGGSVNRYGGYLIVRNSDAHAWSEVWMEERGWVRVDPTAAVAPERINRGSLSAALPEASTWLNDGWGASWRDRFDQVSRYWRQWVVEYDAARQRNLLSPFGVPETDWRQLGIGLVVLGSLALAIGVWLSFRRWREQRPPLLRAWDHFNARLARRGLPRSPAEGPIDYVRRAAGAFPHRAEALLDLGHRFARQRYGSGGELAVEKRLCRDLRRFRM